MIATLPCVVQILYAVLKTVVSKSWSVCAGGVPGRWLSNVTYHIDNFWCKEIFIFTTVHRKSILQNIRKTFCSRNNFFLFSLFVSCSPYIHSQHTLFEK